MLIFRLLILPPQTGVPLSLTHLSYRNSILPTGQGFSLLLNQPLSFLAKATVCAFSRLLLCETWTFQCVNENEK